MGSHILPISIPRPASSSSIPSSSVLTSSSGKVLLKSFDDGSARFLVSSLQVKDAASMDILPLLGRSSSFPSDDTDATGGREMQGRRRFSSGPSPPSGAPHDAFLQDAGDGASETFLLTRLAIKLLGYLGAGYRWVLRLMCLGCYATLLSPGFLQVAYYYYFSSQVIRGIIYGDQPRNRLDLFLPKNCDGPKPVVAFITGGAWIIGYKAWGTLLGKHLSESDIIVACIDYRNFPQGTISDMVKDASQGVSFICKNIAEYGGDPNRIFLMGQSAGAHIAACTLLDHAVKEAVEGKPISWSASQMSAYFGLSGGYNLLNLVQHFHRQGLHSSLFLSIMEGEQSLHRFSPEVLVEDPNLRGAVSLLPPVVLFHGTADTSIPSDSSKSFAETLQRLGVNAKSILYEGKSHTDLFLQDPMRGGEDELLKDLVIAINGHESRAAPQKRLVPEFLLKMARRISPF